MTPCLQLADVASNLFLVHIPLTRHERADRKPFRRPDAYLCRLVQRLVLLRMLSTVGQSGTLRQGLMNRGQALPGKGDLQEVRVI